MNLMLACKSVVKYISRTNSDHLVISLASPGPSSGLMSRRAYGPTTGRHQRPIVWLIGPASFSQTSWTTGQMTGHWGLTRCVARHSASVTKKRRAGGPHNGWSGRTDPSFGPSARRLLVWPNIHSMRHMTALTVVTEHIQTHKCSFRSAIFHTVMLYSRSQRYHYNHKISN